MINQAESSASRRVACIVLAAGQSRRFGSPKMQHEMPDGQTILSATLAMYSKVSNDVFVVLPSGNTKLTDIALQHNVTVVELNDSDKGMSHSLVAGIMASEKGLSDYDGWIIALGDMPYLKLDSIQVLQETVEVDNIIQLSYRGRIGNPVAFGREFKDELLALVGDKGAKQVIRDNPDKVQIIETNDEGVLLDIDYPSAIQI